jgi:hypothetical protein
MRRLVAWLVVGVCSAMSWSALAQDYSIDKDARGYHYWLNFGLRARYQFGA